MLFVIKPFYHDQDNVQLGFLQLICMFQTPKPTNYLITFLVFKNLQLAKNTISALNSKTVLWNIVVALTEISPLNLVLIIDFLKHPLLVQKSFNYQQNNLDSIVGQSQFLKVAFLEDKLWL